MTMKALAGRVARFMGVPADNPELLKAQYRAFSRQLPMMYFILIRAPGRSPSPTAPSPRPG